MALLIGLAGCTPQASPTDRGATGDKTNTEGPGKGKTNGEPGLPDPAAVSTELKHDAFAYNGFDRRTQLTYLFSQFQGDTAKQGTQMSELKSLTSDVAAYSVKRSGSLDQIGDEELEVRPDGVYLVSTEQGSPNIPVRLMPSVVKPGTVWNYDYVLTTTQGLKMTFKGRAKAEKETKLKVAAGEFDTLMVTETAEMDKGGTKGTVSSKTWYAKGVGVVQMKMELKDSSGKIVTSTVELSGTGAK